MILADTSIWADHLRAADMRLQDYLREGDLVMHPFVLGEIALGYLRKRKQILADLEVLPSLHVAEPEEVLVLIERQNLIGAGVGYIDAHLLASAATTPNCRLWTKDRRLARLAVSIGLAAPIDN